MSLLSLGGSGQIYTGDRAVEARIEHSLGRVLSDALVHYERKSGRSGPGEEIFFCRSDLESMWRSEPKPIDAVFGHFSQAQRKALLKHLLLFISFLVKIEVRTSFILTCRDVFFENSESATPKFKDDDLPRSREELLQMGLTPLQARSWKDQYLFMPAKITFAPERWEPQQIDPRVPLPFELSDHAMIHGGFGDDTGYESQYGTVRLYKIPKEYIENEIGGSERWTPNHPVLRIVKSFKARQNEIEEATNMQLLKQSLEKNRNISIHDAIIEQKQDDGTGIVNIVSPYASLGDLAQFLAGGYGVIDGQRRQIYDMAKKFHGAADTHQLRISLLEQSKRLADALVFLHNGFRTSASDCIIKCAHLDLKPSNILIFDPKKDDEVVGNWKLCDFGISVFAAEHPQGSPKVKLGSAGDFIMKLEEKTIRTAPKRMPGEYQAPEIELTQLSQEYNVNSKHGGRGSDIWSFGAIFAEVLAFARGNASGVRSFNRKRRCRTRVHGELIQNDFFYTTVDDNMGSTSPLPCVLRTEVSQWLESIITEHQPEAQAPGVCLRCWAECVKSILEVDPRERPAAATLYRWIEQLGAHANDTSIEHVQFGRGGPGPLSPGSEWPKRNHDSISIPSEPPAVPVFNPTGRSHIVKLPLSSNDVVDYDMDGQRLAYLTKTSIELFLVDGARSYHEVEQLQAGHGWLGIKVAEPYLVVWGSKLAQGRDSDLRLYKIFSNGQLSRAQSPARNINFDVVRRRVAVSRRGFIAVIHNDRILILDANDSGLKELSRIQMVWQDPIGKFVDIAFDSPGSILYAWGNHGLYGVLCAYKFEEGCQGVGDEIFRDRYKDSFSQHQTLVLPFDERHECVVAFGPTPTGFFLGSIDQPRRGSSTTSGRNSSSTSSEVITRQRFSEQPTEYYAWAGCTIRDSLLLVGATKKGFLNRKFPIGISEQIIGSDRDGRLRLASKSSEAHSLGTRRDWRPGLNTDLNTDVKLGVIPPKGPAQEFSVVVYSKKGSIEVLSSFQGEDRCETGTYVPGGQAFAGFG